MKKVIFTLFAAIVFSAMAPFLVQAQLGSGRFESEFSRTAEVIDRARSAVSDAKARVMTAEIRALVFKASSFVDLAVNLQAEASQMGRNSRFLEGISATMKARERAFEAINLVRQSGAKLANPADENDNLVLRQLERTDDLIVKIQDQMPVGPSPLLESLFNSAQDGQRQAWEFYRNNQYRPALKLSRQAERTLLRIAARSGEGSAGRQLDNRINQMEQRLEQVEAMIQSCNNSEAPDLYKKALNEINVARREAGNGNTDRAENAVSRVQNMLQKILTLCSDGESLNRVIAQLQSEIERVAPDIQKSGNSEAAALLEAAQSHLREAQSLCANGESEACAAHIKAAQMNVRKAERLAGI